MATYTGTRKIWLKWHQKGNYTQLTNRAENVEESKSLVKTYGPQMAGCRVFCELGVGSGRNLYYFHEKYPEWTYIGNDINSELYNEIKSIYPDLLDWASIEIVDTLNYLRQDNWQADVTFTYGHLMHLPSDVIDEVCALIAKKTKKYILLQEAYLNDKGISLVKRWRYSRYRFDRDYEEMFPGFKLEEKRIFKHPDKKWLRYGRYFFKKIACDKERYHLTLGDIEKCKFGCERSKIKKKDVI